jgi:hypothetical protein
LTLSSECLVQKDGLLANQAIVSFLCPPKNLFLIAPSVFEEAWASTAMIKPSLAAALTGWSPRKMSLVDGIEIYWQAYLASLE